MRKSIGAFGVCGFALCGALFGSGAAAADEPAGTAVEIPIEDTCYSLDRNEDWFRLFAEFSKAFSAKDYDKALSYTRELEQICSRSPVLNYSIANTYLQKGNLDIAKGYIESATLNLKEFSASDEMTQKIWFMRYELDNHGKYVALSDVRARENALQTELARSRESASESADAMKSHYETIMWTGTGIGAAGLASLIAGAAVVGVNRKLSGYVAFDSMYGKSKTLSITGSNLRVIEAGYAIIGIGVGATVAGAVMAGLGGYHCKRLADAEKGTSVSFSVSPQSIEFGVVF